MKMKNSIRFAIILVLFVVHPALAGNWPGWRGPEGTGVTTEKGLPVNWSTNENVRWRVELPGPGNASPIVWGTRVFLNQAAEQRRTVMCLDRATGKLLWQSGVTYTEREPTQENNPYCAGTPATDGKHVFVSFGSAGIFAYDFEGKEAWHRDLGQLNHMFGNAISPVLYGDLCIVNFGPDAKARVIALKKETGETVWEADPPKPDDSERLQGPGGRGFGPGTFMAPQMMLQADKNSDQKVSSEEFSALADLWFDKLDSEKTGKLTKDQVIERLTEVMPPPPGFAGNAGSQGGTKGPNPGGSGPGRFMGPTLFSAFDADENGVATREEVKQTFAKWFAAWDQDKSGALDERQLREGLNSVFPRPGNRGPGGNGGPGGGDPSGSWSTPLLIKVDGHDELVVNFPNRLVGYDPKTGKQLWLSKGLSGVIYTTPLWGEGTLVAVSSGMGSGSAIAIKPGGTGDITESQRVWRLDRVKNEIGSGVIHGKHLFTISADGIAECLDLGTGNKLWEERLQGPGSRNSSWSSMLLADDRIYVPNQEGDVFVLRAGPKFEVLATNSVREPTNASLAASADDLFMRTDKSLFCFASKK
jgi:outer membrane protein assembly factor BamB